MTIRKYLVSLFLVLPLVLSSCGETGNASVDNTGKSSEVTRKAYTINFDLNGGKSDSYSGSKNIDSFSDDIFFYDCTKEGYNFRGWSYDGIKIFDEKGNKVSEPTLKSEMTFVALYEKNVRLTITMNIPDGGLVTGEGIYAYNSYVDVTAVPLNENRFLGWYYQGNLLSTSLQYKYMMWDKDITLEAKFAYKAFNFYVKSNHSEYGLVLVKSEETQKEYSSSHAVVFDYKSKVTVSAYSKKTVRFLGWYDKENNLVSVNAVYDFIMPYEDYALEAKWNYFTISYFLSGGENSKDNPYSYTLDDSTINLSEPTRKGYRFVAWKYKDRYITSINPNWADDVELVAIWDVITYSITYHLNGGTNSSLNPDSYTVDTETIYLESPTRNGYNFSGWYTDSYYENSLYRIRNGSVGDLNLYAKWEAIEYTITYNLNGGTNNKYNPTRYTVESSSLELSGASKNGYTFLGWKYNGQYVTSINPSWATNITLDAQWSADSYSITYHLNGGTNSSLNPSSYTIETSNISLKDPYRNGYTFLGWYTESSFQNKKTTISKGSYGNIDLYAKWRGAYTITYNLNGGTNSSDNPTYYSIDDTITLSTPTRRGYKFLGWKYEGEYITTIGPNWNKNITLDATWETVTYTITYHLNGGTISKENPATYTIETPTFTLNEPTRNGYRFDGWYSDSLFTYRVTDFSKGNVGDRNLYAKWIGAYIITYNLNGGINSSDNPTIFSIDDEIALSDPTRDGYIFLGWYDNGTKVEKIEKGSTTDITLEAKWSANLNSLTVISEDINKGTVTIVAGQGYTDEKITVKATPASGYVFKAWYEGNQLLSRDETYTFTMPKGDKTLIAYFCTAAEKEANDKSIGKMPNYLSETNTLTYGLYPQTHVSDASLISTLNTLTTAESNGWYLYDGTYYAKKKASPYSSSYTFSDGTTIVNGTAYWFKCEPIEWKVLSSDNGTYSLVSTVLLDEHQYYSSTSDRTINGKTVYPNNYKYSDIRSWLNSDFYNAAFSLNSSYVQTVEVDNSASTTDSSTNRYACENTNDKVYLLSYQDYMNTSYFPDDASRYCKLTDYAKANGAYCNTSSGSYNGNGSYWTRSPYRGSSDHAWGVYYGGYLISNYVRNTCIGVRPAITIKI